MSDTPRTDRESFIARIVQPDKQTKVLVVSEGFSQILERELTRCREENDKLLAEVAALTKDKERLEAAIRNVINSAVEPAKAHYASMVPLAPLRNVLAARKPTNTDQ